MPLPHPLSALFGRCQTLCVPECCGIAAFDFSPIHVASYLLMWRGAPDAAEVAQLREQLQELSRQYGTAGTVSKGLTIPELNQVFSADEIDDLVRRISTSLDRALALIAEVQKEEPSEAP